ncbi:MAG: M23 family metallopeptidase [Clostridia bacterium]|nr:M23 family metallopeptidase [Clostridia bacterium]
MKHVFHFFNGGGPKGTIFCKSSFALELDRHRLGCRAKRSVNSEFIPTDIFAWPLQSNGNITSGYGYRTDPISGEHKLHGGTDLAAPTGTPILASADGVVIAATWHNSYGYYVKIQHNDNTNILFLILRVQ